MTAGHSRAVAPTAVWHTESQLALAVLVFRAGGIVGMAWSLISGLISAGPKIPSGQTALFALVLLAENLVLCAACRRHHRIRTSWAVADMFSTLCFLLWWRLLLPTNVIYFVYPYTLVASVSFAVALRRPYPVVACTAALAFANSTAEVVLGHGTAVTISHAVYDAGTYAPFTLIGYFVAKAMRSSARQLDAARETASRLAAERERLLHARILHDRVLQTLEALARGPWLPESALRDQVAEEAAWLRGFVAAADDPAAAAAAAGGNRTGLLDGLRELTERNARNGLRVQLNSAVLAQDPDTDGRLAPHATAELLAAVGEALANVRKHAEVDRAVLRVSRTSDSLSISVLDHGRGFDPESTPRSIGLRQNVTARLEELGGSATIESALGVGTYVELTVPLAPVGAAAPQ